MLLLSTGLHKVERSRATAGLGGTIEMVLTVNKYGR